MFLVLYFISFSLFRRSWLSLLFISIFIIIIIITYYRLRFYRQRVPEPNSTRLAHICQSRTMTAACQNKWWNAICEPHSSFCHNCYFMAECVIDTRFENRFFSVLLHSVFDVINASASLEPLPTKREWRHSGKASHSFQSILAFDWIGTQTHFVFRTVFGCYFARCVSVASIHQGIHYA